MASRSSSGIGVGITITLLGVACLTLFITTIVFLSKYNATQRNLKTTLDETSQYVRADEREVDSIRRLRDAASKENKSVVGYLNTSLQTAMQRSTGSRGDTVEMMAEKLRRIDGADNSSLVAVIGDRDREIADLNTRLQQAERDRQTALANQANESARVQQITESHEKTIAAMNSDIQRYKDEVDAFRAGVDEAKAFMNSEVEKFRDRGATTESSLNEKIAGLENENLQLKDQLAKLRGDRNRDILRGLPEESLVDGNVIGLDPGANTITIDLGRQKKVVLGMRFAVYSDATAVRPDAAGNYPEGKAVAEIISIGETSATARVLNETRGNPIVRGDVVANAVYDPNKTYTLLVYGNFDANGDGMSTPAESDEIRAMIDSWGGKVTDELTGDVDFLVLGQRPMLPPRPDVGAPMAVILEYQRLDQMAVRYDELFRQATSTSIPILNENRLYTLIGRRPGQR